MQSAQNHDPFSIRLHVRAIPNIALLDLQLPFGHLAALIQHSPSCSPQLVTVSTAHWPSNNSSSPSRSPH